MRKWRNGAPCAASRGNEGKGAAMKAACPHGGEQPHTAGACPLPGREAAMRKWRNGAACAASRGNEGKGGAANRRESAVRRSGKPLARMKVNHRTARLVLCRDGKPQCGNGGMVPPVPQAAGTKGRGAVTRGKTVVRCRGQESSRSGVLYWVPSGRIQRTFTSPSFSTSDSPSS